MKVYKKWSILTTQRILPLPQIQFFVTFIYQVKIDQFNFNPQFYRIVFVFLEKVKMNYVKAIRPWPLMSVPYQREKTHHKLVLQDFQEIMPPEDLRSFKLILGLVVMDINGELPHFSLLVVDNVRKQVKHFCSLQVKSWQFLKMHFYNHIQCCQRAVCKFREFLPLRFYVK